MTATEKWVIGFVEWNAMQFSISQCTNVINILPSFANCQRSINEDILVGLWTTHDTSYEKNVITCLFVSLLKSHPITMNLQNDRHAKCQREKEGVQIYFLVVYWGWSHHFHQVSLDLSHIPYCHAVPANSFIHSFYIYVSIGVAPEIYYWKYCEATGGHREKEKNKTRATYARFVCPNVQYALRYK